jgi:hypothetical protein
MMVPQPDKIQQFMTKQGDKAMERMAMTEYAEEVRVLYRFTSDLRCVNDRTKLEIHPLPLISSLIDRTCGSAVIITQDMISNMHFLLWLWMTYQVHTLLSRQSMDTLLEYIVMPQANK